ncbi:MAG: DUF4832 domain-containing protein [Candidatus Acidiferrales bacterium]
MRSIAIVGILLPALLFAGQSITVRPIDNGTALVNPSMGWIFYYYDDNLTQFNSSISSTDTLDYFPGLSVVYMRLAWSYLEPVEGIFDWTLLDGPAQRFIANGKKIAFRFTTSESDSPSFATPKWVQEAGAKGYYFEKSKGVVTSGTHWEPDYDDPVYLSKLAGFLQALAARYDGNPNVAFIDVAFGTWGEGHTIYTTKIPYSAAEIDRHVDLYRKYFQKTLLVVNDDMASQGRGMEPIEHAAKLGLTLRDDSILVNAGDQAYSSAYMAPLFWTAVPVILETQYYGLSRDQGIWQDGGKYLEAVEAYHASYAAIHWSPREFLDANRNLIDKVNQRLGYRLQLAELSWPALSPADSRINLRYSLRNAGVAPCYPGGYPAFTLKDDAGDILAVLVDDKFDVRQLDVGAVGVAPTVQRSVLMTLPPTVRPGSYQLFFSVGDRKGTPRLQLPLDNRDQGDRYLVGTLMIR